MAPFSTKEANSHARAWCLEILMSSTHYYHTQPKPVSTRPICPVCNQPAYSLAGIHPQCAERQADPPRPKAKPKEAAVLVPQAPPVKLRPRSQRRSKGCLTAAGPDRSRRNEALAKERNHPLQRL